MMEWIRFAVIALCFAAGISVLFLSVFGTYRLRFALNRIHASALIETLVLMLFTVAFIIAEDISFSSVKFVLVLILQWCTSPLASHMMAKLEYLTDENLFAHCSMIDRTEEAAPDAEEAAEEQTKGDSEA